MLMPDLRTEITEIMTGLGCCGLPSPALALARPPAGLANVTEAHWDQLRAAYADGRYDREFAAAWANGQHFLRARDGLRSRLPRIVEWKGAHRPPAYEQVPADLRVDHVYLVSCKYQSRVLFNPSPAHLFDRCLSDRTREAAVDWYRVVAPEAYQALYTCTRDALGLHHLPAEVAALGAEDRRELKSRLRERAWPTPLQGPYRTFCSEVARASAARWQGRLTSHQTAEHMLWRLLRLGSAPYFVLGDSDAGPLRLRVHTPWDWRQAWELLRFEVRGDADSGQPLVRWHAEVKRRTTGDPHRVDGHVEIRWSHGRFGGHPEAKVYLDTPHAQVPGYEVLL